MRGPPERFDMRRNAVIAAIVPLALLGPFYLWIGAVWVFVGMPPSVDHLPPWLKLWDIAGIPLLFLFFLPSVFLVVLTCIGLLPFHRFRAPATAFLLSSVAVWLFLAFIDPGGWFRWFMD